MFSELPYNNFIVGPIDQKFLHLRYAFRSRNVTSLAKYALLRIIVIIIDFPCAWLIHAVSNELVRLPFSESGAESQVNGSSMCFKVRAIGKIPFNTSFVVDAGTDNRELKG